YPGSPPGSPDAPYFGGLLADYIAKNWKIYRCPADPTNSPTWAARGNKLSTYVMNGAALGYKPSPPLGQKTHKLTLFKGDSYMMWEPSDTSGSYGDGSSNPNTTEGPSTRHQIGCVVTGYDGHSQLLKFRTFMNQAALMPSAGWCDPDSPKGDGVGCGLW